MTDVNSNYSMDYFIEDVQRIMSSGSNRSSIVEQIEPLLKQVMHRNDLLQESLKVEMGDGRYSYTFFRTEDESLAITAPAFLPGRPTPVHDHLTWGVIGVYSGRQKTTRYLRIDHGESEGIAELKLYSDQILTRGASYPLIPPDDIHRIEALGDDPGISIHVLGTDLRHQKRHMFNPEDGTVEDWDGGSMMR